MTFNHVFSSLTIKGPARSTLPHFSIQNYCFQAILHFRILFTQVSVHAPNPENQTKPPQSLFTIHRFSSPSSFFFWVQILQLWRHALAGFPPVPSHWTFRSESVRRRGGPARYRGRRVMAASGGRESRCGRRRRGVSGECGGRWRR